MAESLDSIVKGAPDPRIEEKAPALAPSPIGPLKPGDPLNHTPCSPSMIYLNLLILEASLRAQYLSLRARRRKHTFFLTLLSLWVAGFGYALFFAVREDGVGVGGSVYWVVDMAEKVAFLAGILTALLIWATGIWERGIRWPRRWFAISNRGLRGFNCKLIVIQRSWWVEMMSFLGFFITYGAFSRKPGQYRYVEPSIMREVDKELKLARQDHPQLPFISGDEEKGGHEEDLAPGGDYVKLLLLPKPFTPNFRENWELYRSEYWERENERRALLRTKLRQRDIELAKRESRWLWWIPARRQVEEKQNPPPPSSGGDHEKSLHHRHSSLIKEHRRMRSNSNPRRPSLSAGSSRAPSPSIEVEEVSVSRRGSTASNSSAKGRKKHVSTGSKSKRPGVESRSVTPEVPSPLALDNSGLSEGGADGNGRTLRKKTSDSSVTR
ncbi:Spo7-like protein-domain-containing protein [Xylariales sp. PMI_506]|nr:Spo7-like protein-domain-containing protein [Xylariales sp. PMI_506]